MPCVLIVDQVSDHPPGNNWDPDCIVCWIVLVQIGDLCDRIGLYRLPLLLSLPFTCLSVWYSQAACSDRRPSIRLDTTETQTASCVRLSCWSDRWPARKVGLYFPSLPLPLPFFTCLSVWYIVRPCIMIDDQVSDHPPGNNWNQDCIVCCIVLIQIGDLCDRIGLYRLPLPLPLPFTCLSVWYSQAACLPTWK